MTAAAFQTTMAPNETDREKLGGLIAENRAEFRQHFC